MNVSNDNYLEQFRSEGISDVIDVGLGLELLALQSLIGDLTTPLLAPELRSAKLSTKINAPFAVPASGEVWSRIMRTVNESAEFTKIVESDAVINTFRKVFRGEPKKFPICIFRASMVQHRRSHYDLHQDVGTWYLSAKRQLAHCVPATLWLSINGSTPDNTLLVYPGSHRGKLYRHKNVKGQGYFSALIDDLPSLGDPRVIDASPGQGVIFHGLTVHGTVSGQNMRPRYSIDIRYYDSEFRESYGVEAIFRLQRLLHLGAKPR